MAFKRTLESKELLHGVDVFDLRGHDFHEFGSGSRVSNLCSKNFLYESHTASFQIGRYSLPQSFRYSDNKVMTSGLAPKGQFLGYLLPGMTYDSIVLCFLITPALTGEQRQSEATLLRVRVECVVRVYGPLESGGPSLPHADLAET
jgi:hypothetical protein